MRYTAKARMLSFNWLIDHEVYDMPFACAMLFAGMVTRADNLGRLPGDPSVLLSYLYYPKKPRPDVSDSDMGETLGILASAKPPIITWYEIEGARYVEFTHWPKHQPGLREHNKKSSYPAPGGEGCIYFKPSSPGEPSLFGDDLPAPTTPQSVKVNVAQLARDAAHEAGLAANGEDYDADLVEVVLDRLKLEGEERGEWFKFAQWLWKTGVRFMPVLVDLLEERARLKPENAYAYFAEDGPGRTNTITRKNADRSVAAHNAIRAEEKAFAQRKEAAQ